MDKPSNKAGPIDYIFIAVVIIGLMAKACSDKAEKPKARQQTASTELSEVEVS